MSEWHYRKGKNQFGPISAQELKALADSGQLLPTDLVQKVATAEWRPAREAKGLFADSPATTPDATRSSSSHDEAETGHRNTPLSLLIGLTSIFVGAAAIAAFWTPFAGWTVLLAMVALVAGTLTLLLDWLRDVPRFSVSVMGVVTGTVALSLAFVHQGGLDFQRYKPIVVTLESANEGASEPVVVTRAATKAAEPESPRDEPKPAPEARELRSSVAHRSAAVLETSQPVEPLDGEATSVTRRASLVSGVVVTPLTLEGFPTVAYVALAKPGKGLAFGQVQRTDQPSQMMVVPPGKYDLFYQIANSNHDPICVLTNIDVPAKQTVTVQSNQVVAAIAVNDLGVGAKVTGVKVYLAGSNLSTFKQVNGTTGFGKRMLVAPDVEYDVSVVPEGQQEIAVAEKVRPKPGELLLVGGGPAGRP